MHTHINDEAQAAGQRKKGGDYYFLLKPDTPKEKEDPPYYLGVHDLSFRNLLFSELPEQKLPVHGGGRMPLTHTQNIATWPHDVGVRLRPKFTPWTMKSDHGRWPFSHGPTFVV